MSVQGSEGLAVDPRIEQLQAVAHAAGGPLTDRQVGIALALLDGYRFVGGARRGGLSYVMQVLATYRDTQVTGRQHLAERLGDRAQPARVRRRGKRERRELPAVWDECPSANIEWVVGDVPQGHIVGGHPVSDRSRKHGAQAVCLLPHSS
ncbi:hypothetical protein SEA_CAFASSO_58 [Gordonia phage Cafasso]|uniref:Uncharacterized protein n=1 Tax=Gordonia phage Cafasso TaxID=2851095 RepID=A0AAE7SK17_9CAUD|nr:hypothetical protein SEA_CAFASSO_58 [Gordonia phage Cafasso]